MFKRVSTSKFQRLTVSIVLFLYLLIIVSNVQAATTPATRIGGTDRFEVAVNVSKSWSTAGTVIITSKDAYADALSVTPLAYYYNAPILLTDENTLTSSTKNRLLQLKPNKVIVVGGINSISRNVLNGIDAIVPNVERIDGLNRFEVAKNIAMKLPANSKAFVSNGYAFADALAIAPYAARNYIPILLTNTNNIPSYTSQTLKSRGVSSTTVVGGSVSVSNTVYNQFPGRQRIDGSNRYEVAKNIAEKYNYSNANVYVSNGYKFADALAGSIRAAKENVPILLTDTKTVPSYTMNVFKEKKFKKVTILGGTASVSDSVIPTMTSPIIGKKIVVDAGHGGSDPGSSGNGIIEKTINLDVAKRLQTKLNSGYAYPIMTRSTDTFIELGDRVKKAEDENANIFVSIHVNSFTDPSANGTQTNWNDDYEAANSKELAQYIQDELIKKLGTRDRGLIQDDLYVTRNTTMPSVLVEMAFLSNPNEAKLIKTTTFRQKVADAIYAGIIKYFTYNN